MRTWWMSLQRLSRARRRGIVMMVSLLTLTFIFMLVGAAMTMMPMQLSSSRHSAETQQALRAASSGIDYAQAKVQKDPSWLGDDPVTAAVNLANLQVVEDNGNVIGVIHNGDGSRSAFRFKFNHQNGTNNPQEGPVNLANPALNHMISNPLICINNSEGSNPAPIYDFPDNGQLPGGATSSREIGQYCVLLQVEGLAGPGLNTATVDNLDSLCTSAATRRSIYRQRVQCVLSLSFAARTDSAVYAAGSFTATCSASTGVVNVTEDVGASAPRLRSLDDVNIVRGGYQTSASGQVVVDEAPNGEFTHPDDGGSTTLTATHQRKDVQSSHWLKLNWSQVPHATPSDTQLKAGTYVWKPGVPNPELHYYQQNYDGTLPAGAPTQVITAASQMVLSGSAVDVDFSRLSTMIEGKVYVQPMLAGTVKDFAVVVDPALTTAGQRPVLEFQAPPGQDALLTSTGNLTVKGPIDGYGGVTSEQEVRVEGASIFEANPDAAVAVYAKGNVTIDDIPPPVAAAIDANPANGMAPGMGMGHSMGHHGMGHTSMGMSSGLPFGSHASDVSFTGLVYTLKDFIVNVPNGNFYVRGILTAYGGDPEANEAPGDGTGGNINITANNVEFLYDPSYLGQLRNAGDAMMLDRVSWNTF